MRLEVPEEGEVDEVSNGESISPVLSIFGGVNNCLKSLGEFSDVEHGVIGGLLNVFSVGEVGGQLSF